MVSALGLVIMVRGIYLKFWSLDAWGKRVRDADQCRGRYSDIDADIDLHWYSRVFKLGVLLK